MKYLLELEKFYSDALAHVRALIAAHETIAAADPTGGGPDGGGGDPPPPPNG